MVIADIHRPLEPFVYDLVPSLENLYKPACLALLAFFTTSLHYHHYQSNQPKSISFIMSDTGRQNISDKVGSAVKVRFPSFAVLEHRTHRSL